LNIEVKVRKTEFQYEESLKSRLSDELVNIYCLRPLAGTIVKALYPAPVTANQITVASIFVGVLAAVLYAVGVQPYVAFAGLAIVLKDLLDSADGQLARARGEESRKGRFLDSLGDVLVNALLFSAIGWMLSRQNHSANVIFLSAAGFAGLTLRVSLHVYYSVAHLHLQQRYLINRLREDFSEADYNEDMLTHILHRLYLVIYGWQDALMERVDRWSAGAKLSDEQARLWYGDATALRLSGLIGFGTEYLVLMICSLFNKLELYLWLNLLFMNSIAVAVIFYRRLVLRKIIV